MLLMRLYAWVPYFSNSILRNYSVEALGFSKLMKHYKCQPPSSSETLMRMMSAPRAARPLELIGSAGRDGTSEHFIIRKTLHTKGVTERESKRRKQVLEL